VDDMRNIIDYKGVVVGGKVLQVSDIDWHVLYFFVY